MCASKLLEDQPLPVAISGADGGVCDFAGPVYHIQVAAGPTTGKDFSITRELW